MKRIDTECTGACDAAFAADTAISSAALALRGCVSRKRAPASLSCLRAATMAQQMIHVKDKEVA